MIYTDEFVWLHFPKCAGTKIEQLFRKYFSNQPEVFQDPVGIQDDPSVAWHDSIRGREKRDPAFKLGERVIVCSFRKLPSWLESRYNFEFQRNTSLYHRPEILLEGKFLENSGVENHADDYARMYLPEKILQSGKVRFVKTEFFESDFKSVFGDYLDLSLIPDWEYTQKVNLSTSSLPSEVREQLYDSKAKVYEKCPYWRFVEELAYG